MNELSEYRVVDDAAELAEPFATNGAHGNNGNNGNNGTHAAQRTVAGEAVVQSQKSGSRADSWGPNVPSMRLAPAGIAHDEPEGTATRDADEVTTPTRRPVTGDDPAVRPPKLLRLIRFVVGVLLLAGAWAATVAMLMLVQLLLGGLPAGMDPALQIVLLILVALGALWLALVALACLAAGAFALALALSARGW